MSKAAVETFPAVGWAQDLRLRSPRIAGAALAVDEQVVHAIAFVS